MNFVANRIWSVNFCLSSLIIDKDWKITTSSHWERYLETEYVFFMFLSIKQDFFSKKHDISRLETNTQSVITKSLFYTFCQNRK